MVNFHVYLYIYIYCFEINIFYISFYYFKRAIRICFSCYLKYQLQKYVDYLIQIILKTYYPGCSRNKILIFYLIAINV